ncbi:hypothetical protein N8388_07955 [Octadecabacter sp.]|nr:hypothetical protein [Octadecabacter sp.]MDB4122470.1 hypothetical protein [Octadecabacter sp.]MDC1397140.1 hypothetical protein [Octadecabacter sp.]MDC1501140.1 hypothetical protein [Octadecabacter sp.]
MAVRNTVILTAGNTHKSEGFGQLVQMSSPILASDDTDGIANSCLPILASSDSKPAEVDAAMTRMGQTYGLFSQLILAVVAQSMSEPSSSLGVLSRRLPMRFWPRSRPSKARLLGWECTPRASV